VIQIINFKFSKEIKLPINERPAFAFATAATAAAALSKVSADVAAVAAFLLLVAVLIKDL
jgi:hypothetical protein